MNNKENVKMWAERIRKEKQRSDLEYYRAQNFIGTNNSTLVDIFYEEKETTNVN